MKYASQWSHEFVSILVSSKYLDFAVNLKKNFWETHAFTVYGWKLSSFPVKNDAQESLVSTKFPDTYVTLNSHATHLSALIAFFFSWYRKNKFGEFREFLLELTGLSYAVIKILLIYFFKGGVRGNFHGWSCCTLGKVQRPCHVTIWLTVLPSSLRERCT